MLLYLFGGSFDPPHNGHVYVARYFSTLADLVLISPLNASEDKAPVAPAEFRVHMCELAFQGIENVQVTSIDIERGSTTYTIDTIRDVQAAYPTAEIHVVIGVDALLSLSGWKDIVELKSLVAFDVVARKGFTLKEKLEVPFSLHTIGAPEISSSSIRDIAHAADFDEHALDAMLPRPVSDYLQKNRLYQG